jgi:cytoskeletal protein CcmA (bactofilin family)
MNRKLRRGAAFAVAALLLVILVMGASVALGNALLLDGKLRTGDTVTVPASETWNGSLYVLAGRATVDGTVDGDLTVLGGQVEVNGHVTGDVLAAGGNVSISGKVDGDVRVAGGQVNVAGAIKGDLAVAGGQMTIPGGGTIGGDLIVSAGQATVSGSVAGSIEGTAGAYSRSGSLGGKEHVVIAQSQAPAAVADQTVPDALRHFVVVFLFGALLLWWMPRGIAAADQVMRKRPWLALGGGFLAFIGYVVFIVLAIIAMILLALLFGVLRIGSLVAIDVVGGILGITVVSFLFVLACAFVADALVGLAAAHVAIRMDLRNRWQELGLLAVGAAVVVIVTNLPVVGGWIKFAVILFGLGALTIAWWDAWRAGRKAKAAPEPAT